MVQIRSGRSENRKIRGVLRVTIIGLAESEKGTQRRKYVKSPVTDGQKLSSSSSEEDCSQKRFLD